jgi:hypothetical protein
MAMKSLTQNHAFAQVGRIFFIRMPTHFDSILPKYAVYPNMIDTNTGLNTRGSALSTRISRSLSART